MTAEEYTNRIGGKDVLDHTTLNVTLKELAARKEVELAASIKRIIENNKIEKPELHSQPLVSTSTYYVVDLSFDDLQKIADLFSDLEVEHLDVNGETTPTAAFYATLLDKWLDLEID